jgi:DNA-binding CsgD family transcriptional regulator/tetratricopeptide (TPR) repeat protein
VELLERAEPLAFLESRLADAASGSGSVTLLCGEAGIGKTSLVQAFCARHSADAQVLRGACDALATPRPLGPLHDIARDAGGHELARLIAVDATQHERFTAFLDLLTSPLRPVIVVIEDVHWADEATLDMLVFVARRVAGSNACLVVTFRDDELRLDHPLRAVLGSLATLRSIGRLRLLPLSERAVARLATGHRLDAGQVWRVTGGNAFFVTEVLATPPGLLPAGAVPAAVRDAVLARAARLSAPARALLDKVAVVPDRAEIALLGAAGDGDRAVLDECLTAGMLQCDSTYVHFRHELARLAVEEGIPGGRALGLHAAVLTRLADRPGTDPARLAYHADRAGDREAVLAHAPVAAAAAARLGAHREALAHYQLALRCGDLIPAHRRGELWEECAREYGILDRVADALEAFDQAVAAWRAAGDVDRAARVMARQAHGLWSAGRGERAHELAAAAVALLADRPPGPALAAVHAYASYLRVLTHDLAGAVAQGTRAIALAEAYDERRVLAVALNAVGTALWFTDPDRAESTLVRAIEVARDSGSDPAATQAMVNLGSTAAEVRQYRTAERWLRETLDWCRQRGHDRQAGYGRAWLARCHLEQGRWADAAVLLDQAAAQPTSQVPTRIVVLTSAGRLGTRRGDPAARAGGGAGNGSGMNAEAMLAEAWQLATQTGDLRYRWPVVAARAEAAWLSGHCHRIAGLVDEVYRAAARLEHQWAIGELAFWRWRAGLAGSAPPAAAEPYARQIDGDWAGAARAWEELGCPYEAAMARADSDRPGDLLAALETLHQLGARPLARLVGRRLHERGIRQLPRRPHQHTVDNPGRLTDRQLEVARLLADDLSNAEIAARLHISPRTAGHHVAAILTTLGVRSRQDAARAVRRWGSPSPQPPG